MEFQLNSTQLNFLIQHKQSNPTHSWKRITKKFIKKFNILTPIDSETLREAYSAAKKDLSLRIEPSLYENWSAFTQSCTSKDLSVINSNPNSYFYNHPVPGMKEMKGSFSEQEVEFFIRIMGLLHEYPQWGNLATLFPGRSGSQLRDLYKRLYEKQLVGDIQIEEKTFNFASVDHHALHQEQEGKLYMYIIERFHQGLRTTMKMVAEKALDIYYDEDWLVRKVARDYHFENKIDMVNEDGTYTQSFLEYQDRAKQLYEEDPDAFFAVYGLPQFRASMGWVSSFLVRHHLSIRRAHRKRRNEVKTQEIELYLRQLNQAFIKYGPDRVFNMDETSVLINSQSPTTIAPTGSEDVFIFQNSSEKERFTALGTCSRNNTFPLIILAKGDSNVCERKFGRHRNCVLFHSHSGWTNETTMIQYLEWLHEQVEGQPCALVLDCFSAHFCTSVLRRALELQIELIRVPKNGTGAYQPLDRTIFGVVKAKLRSLDVDMKDPKLRFNIVAENLVKAWGGVTRACLRKAWDIPGLEDELAAEDEIEEEEEEP